MTIPSLVRVKKVRGSLPGSKECENILDEMFFIIIETFPVFDVTGKINFISNPEGS